MAESDFEHDVFVNCPFDDAYQALSNAIIFAVHDCGFVARSALEVKDASQVRIDKITSIIAGCKFGIHDISRTELDAGTSLPRFNMPLELGLFLGAKRFGKGKQREKSCLILDTERYRYQKFVSDIAGQDIAAHNGNPDDAVKQVRNWLRAATPKSVKLPGGSEIARRYADFRAAMPDMCAYLQLRPEELTFNDYVLLVEEWLKAHPNPAG